MGAEPGPILDAYPQISAITGPQDYESVMAAVHKAAPPTENPFIDLLPPQGIKLTPRHYAYLKISEGCHNRCTFCIIPKLRGDLVSRPAGEVLREAEKLVKAGVKELLVVSQDTSAYGQDLRYEASLFHDREVRARFFDLARELGEMDAWVRLHYVYPYPHVDEVIPLMAEGKVLPYLDIPVPARGAQCAARHEAAGQCRKDARPHSRLAGRLPGSGNPLHLHRRLSRRDGGGFPDPARLARRGQARPGRRLQI